MEAVCEKFNPRILNETTRTLTLKWDEISEAEVYKIVQKFKGDKWRKAYWGSSTTAKMENLEDSFCYKFRILAMKLIPDEGYKVLCSSNVIMGTTKALPPSTDKLFRAVKKGQQYVTKKILNTKPSLVNIPATDGYSPLASAIIYGQNDVVDVLLSSGVNVHAGNPFNKRTPLHLAFYYGNLPVSRMLLNKKADINARDIINMTPSHYVVDAEQLDLLKFALANNVDKEAKDNCGWTLLLRAIGMNCSLLLIKLLVSFGCKVDATDKNGNSCRRLAQLSGRQSLITYFENLAKHS